MKNLTLDMAMLILEKLDGVAITDSNGKYIYANENWFETSGITKESINGKFAWEVFPNTNVISVIKTKQKLIGQIVPIPGGNKQGITNYYPLMKDDKFIGVLIWVIFSGMDLAIQFSNKIEKLSGELIMAQKQIENLSTSSYSINNIIGISESIKKVKFDIMNAGRTNSTVLIEGETGTGKELVAHAIHDLSTRSHQRFVRVNCPAIPPNLMESEFFGYEDGAFTGAKKGGSKGKFELANKGSIFFDEINSLPMTMQPKFLRVLQEREVERIGGKNVIPIDVRVIAATNVSLKSLADEGNFRTDLYYRLNVINIRIPPLRERLEDIPVLVKYLIDKLNHLLGMNISDVDNNVISLFMNYSWPGNIRELQNVLERAMNNCYGSVLTLEHFDFFEKNYIKNKKTSITIKQQKQDLEKIRIIDLLSKNKGNKTATADELGISRTALYKKLKKYEIDV